MVHRNYLAIAALLAGLILPLPLLGAIEVIDDTGQHIRLEQPARRLVSLAPHVTENLFSAGVGDRIVGTVNYSDYPEAARAIPQVGGYDNFNIELIHLLHTVLIIAWQEGNQLIQVEQLQALGYTVYIDYPRDMEGVAKGIRNFGVLTGNEQEARRVSEHLLTEMGRLRETYAAQAPVTVFYQVWSEPLITVNDRQIIGQSIRICGGRNIFAELENLTPRVSLEDVLASDPEIIVASGMDERRPEWLDEWTRWPVLRAVRDAHLFFIPPDIIQRHTLRLLDGATLLCRQIHQVRQERWSPPR